jgi:hypothetical protein
LKLHPFYEVAAAAGNQIKRGSWVWQQFICARCAAKQTMEIKNMFFKAGKCEVCGHITDIEKDGCNYMMQDSALNYFRRPK